MSTYAKVPTAFNLQLDSRLCQAPTEIRQTIYAHLIAKNFHVSLHRGQLRLSACIDHYRRWLCVDGIWNSDSGRSWGPHWKCSDIALGKPRNEDKHEIITTLQLICKSMYLDVVSYMAGLSVFCFTEPAPLQFLFQTANLSNPGSLTFSGFPGSMLAGVRKLNVTVMLNRAFSLQLDDRVESPASGASGTASTSPIPMWPQTFSALSQLKQLHKLEICVDLAYPKPWATVNERALVDALGLSNNIPPYDITLNLPKLHPRYEDPDRHFIENSVAPSLKIRRRLREEYEFKDDLEQTKAAHLAYERDFPILPRLLRDLQQWVVDAPLLGIGAGVKIGSSRDYEKLRADVEEKERLLWKDGFDVEGYYHALVDEIEENVAFGCYI